MRKRLEEAADNAGISTYNKAYGNAVKTFKEGAEFGYKEAIAMAKEWLKEKLNYIPMEGFLAAFEAEMNKLWEGEK